MSRTNIVIDRDLVQEAMDILGVKSMRAAVDRALRLVVLENSSRISTVARQLKRAEFALDRAVDAYKRVEDAI